MEYTCIVFISFLLSLQSLLRQLNHSRPLRLLSLNPLGMSLVLMRGDMGMSLVLMRGMPGNGASANAGRPGNEPSAHEGKAWEWG